MRICKECGESKSADGFAINRHGNLNGICRSCYAARKRKKYATDPEARRKMLDGQRKWKYDVSREQLEEMLSRQGGGCAICGATDPGGKGDWHIDHDHACCDLPPDGSGRTCGQCTRGALCAKCNVGLGSFGDDIEKLASAMAYLMSTQDLLSGLTSSGQATASVRTQRQSPV